MTIQEFTEERRVRNELYVLDAGQLDEGERVWFYSHANDLIEWTPLDLTIAKAMIYHAAERRKPKKRKGK
jgi:hypothetical protein